MTIAALLSKDNIFIGPEIKSKKRLLEFIANQSTSALEEYTKNKLYCNLLDRERLGSTGLGRGFAVPHARIADLDEAFGVFIKLNQAIKFEAPDNLPVDLVFAIVIPEQATDQHLQILSALAKIFSQPEVCEAIRQAESREEIINFIEAAEQ